jgi:hypothetical protein
MSAKTGLIVGDFIRPLTVDTRYRRPFDRLSFLNRFFLFFFATALFFDPRFTNRQPEQCNRDEQRERERIPITFQYSAAFVPVPQNRVSNDGRRRSHRNSD